VSAALRPPDQPLADDLIRLEPVGARFIPDFERLIEDPDVIRNTRVPSNPPPGFAARWVGLYEHGWEDGTRAGYAVLDESGTFFGFAGIVDLDLASRQGEIGYVVAREARGRGIATRALQLVTEWALDGLGLERVELHIDPENPASARVAERCGYHREGVLRSVHFKEDLRGDVAIYSLLATDPR
jgi:RimJ/RimL family protein N-acetyltransferase